METSVKHRIIKWDYINKEKETGEYLTIETSYFIFRDNTRHAEITVEYYKGYSRVEKIGVTNCYTKADMKSVKQTLSANKRFLIELMSAKYGFNRDEVAA